MFKNIGSKKNRPDWVYISIIILCLILGLFFYKTAEAGIIDWLLGGVRIVEVKAEVAEPKTLDSEIDRLAIKYGVSSSTAREIIKCESSMYSEAVNHNRLSDGTIWSSDRFHFQINDYYHEATMKRLGLDYYNQWDSLEYGFILLKEQGTKPWKASQKCWQSKIDSI
jgi:hypothetical protein